MPSAASNAIIAAFTTEQTHRLTGVSEWQLRSWAADQFFVPSLAIEEDDFPFMRLYSFRDLVCLKVINLLRNETRIPLHELRNVKERLAHLGEDMWATTTLYILRKRVVFDNPETGEKRQSFSKAGYSTQDILTQYPTLKEEDIQAAIAYKDVA